MRVLERRRGAPLAVAGVAVVLASLACGGAVSSEPTVTPSVASTPTKPIRLSSGQPRTHRETLEASANGQICRHVKVIIEEKRLNEEAGRDTITEEMVYAADDIVGAAHLASFEVGMLATVMYEPLTRGDKHEFYQVVDELVTACASLR